HLGAIDNGVAAGFPEMCVSQPNGIGSCPTSAPGIWSEGYDLDNACHGFGLVTILDDPDRLILQAVDQYGNIQISYTVAAASATPTPRPTATATFTPMPTATATATATPTPTATATATPITCNPVSFAAATNFSAGDAPASVAVGDFNGDGNQDVALANYTVPGNVSILLGDGAGHFSRPINFAAGDGP